MSRHIPTASDDPPLTPQLLVWAYSRGLFPMARSRRSRTVEWFSPSPRAVLPLDAFHVPHGLRRRLRKNAFTLSLDQAFNKVIRACARPRANQHESWINAAIVRAYSQLHHLGLAHSVEAWLPDAGDDGPGRPPARRRTAAARRRLVGGLYGVALGGAFFGESMFSLATDASKVCLHHLVEHLCRRGYRLLDVQLANPHLDQFGVELIPRDEYLHRLRRAIALPVTWTDSTVNSP